MVPEGWSKVRFEEVGGGVKNAIVDGPFGSNLKSEHYREEGIPVFQSGFVTDGTFSPTKYVFVDEGLFVEQQRSAARGGDILMAKIGAQAGRCAVIPIHHEEGILAGNSLKITPAQELYDRDFILHWLSDRYDRTGLSEIKSKTAQPAISIKNLKRLWFVSPPFAEQKKIAEILSTWDRAIEVAEAQLVCARTQKRALMQQLLKGRRRFPEFANEPWETAEFTALFQSANDKKTQVNKRDYQQSGSIPIVDQGKEFIVGYTDSESTYSSVPVIVFGDHTREIKWVDFEFCPGADGTQLLKTKQPLSIKYGYYLLQNLELPSLGYSRHMRELKQSVFEFPASLEEQQKIVLLLESADSEVLFHKENAQRLRTEKKALMQQLLTGKRRVSV